MVDKNIYDKKSFIKDIEVLEKYELSDASSKQTANSKVEKMFSDTLSFSEKYYEKLKIIARLLPKETFAEFDSNGFLTIKYCPIPKMKITEESYFDVFEEIKSGLNKLVTLFKTLKNPDKGRIFENSDDDSELLKEYFLFCKYYNTLIEIIRLNEPYKKSVLAKVRHKALIENDKNKKVAGVVLSKKQDIVAWFNKEKEESEKFSYDFSQVSFGNGYEDDIFLGNVDYNFSDSNKVTAKKYFDIDLDSLKNEPMLYSPYKKYEPLFFECSSGQMKSENSDAFFKTFILSLIRGSAPKKSEIAAIEDSNCNRLSISVSYYMNNYSVDFVYGGGVKKKDTEIVGMLRDIKDTIDSREKIYINSGKNDIYQYNKDNTSNQEKIIYLIVNNYPECFTNLMGEFNKEAFILLKYILGENRGVKAGVIPVILFNSDEKIYGERRGEYSVREKFERIDSIIKNKVLLKNVDFENGKMMFGNNSIKINLLGKDFNLSEYIVSLKKSLDDKSKYLLPDFIKEINKKIKSNEGKDNRWSKTSPKFAYSGEDYKLRIPIGKNNNEIYDFVTDVAAAPSAIILGTSGSGKSSFLHTLILSASYMYSPEQLSICIVDFKSGNSDNFGNYLQRNNSKTTKSYYVPHIVYMSTNNSEETIFDVFEKIISIENQRAKLFTDIGGASNIVEYNKKVDELNAERTDNKIKKMSRILFIIDEFNNIFTNKKRNTNDRIFEILKNIRAYGICILFCGQDGEVLESRHMSQIDTRIAFSGFNAGSDYLGPEGRKVTGSLSQKGYAVIRPHLASPLVDVVRTTYAGDDDMKYKFASEIRKKWSDEKYANIQEVAGETSVIPVSQEKNLENAIIEDNKICRGYPVYLGESTNSDTLIPMYFESSSAYKNYLVSGTDVHLTRIEQNIALGFLYQMAVRGIAVKKQNIIYGKMSEDMFDNKNIFDDYFKNYDILKDYISCNFKAMDIAKQIMTTYKTFEKRQALLQTGNFNVNSEDSTPILLILHNFKWLETDSWIEKKENKPEPVASEENAMSAKLDEVNKKLGLDEKFGGLVASLKKFKVPEKQIEKVEEVEIKSASSVKRALKKLYYDGINVNVFVVFASSTMSAISDSLDIRVAGDISSETFVADRIDPMNSSSLSMVESCCFVNSFKKVKEILGNREQIVTKQYSNRTRLFDYSVENNKQWWEEKFIPLLEKK